MAAPKVAVVSVDGAQNSPSGDPNGPGGEVMLDIEVAGAVAPDAEIVVYFGPNTDQGFYDAIAAAVHDSQNNPSVISISRLGRLHRMVQPPWRRHPLGPDHDGLTAAAAMRLHLP